MKSIIKLLFIIIMPITVQAQITGTVFRDFNGNGLKDINEPLLPGITVNAYSTSGLCGSAVTSGNSSPNYSISGCGASQVRVEFVLPTTGTCVYNAIDYSGYYGPTYGSSVQFTTGNASNINFAVHSPVDYRGNASNPMVYVPCYVNGDPLGGGNSGSDGWFVGFPYSNSGTTGVSLYVDGSTLGATWGVAYSSNANILFTSAFMKRHSGLGAGGSGAIYTVDPTSGSVSIFYDMDANGYRTRAAGTAPSYGLGSSFSLSGNNIANYLGSIDPLTGEPSGLGVIGSNTDRGLPDNYLVPNNDPAAFDQVGKVALGGLELSEDGKYLFVVNLYDRKVYRLELNSVSNPTAVTAVTSYTLPNPGCSNGKLRPFALRYANGKLYVGAVCSGEDGGSINDLTAYVYALDSPKGSATFNATPILSFPLDYQKGGAINWAGPYGTSWNPWNNDSEASIGLADNETYPTPWLTDIDFNERGDMVIAFTDRSGHQWGENNKKNLSGNYLFRYTAGGDILIAGNNCAGYSLESGGDITSINGQSFSGSALPEGPGGGEFFQGDNYTQAHLETGIGSIANLKGTNEVIVTIFDPFALNEGGTKKLSNNNGTEIAGSAYKLYGTGLPDYGKANGLGEMEFKLPIPPIEIGNRVWLDNNSNGIQDPDEPGIAGVTVQLVKAGTVIATATTDANGNYYFSNNPTGTDNDGDGVNDNIFNITQLMPNMQYSVRIPNVQGGSKQGALSTYSLTTANAGGGTPGTQADVRDSDGTLAANDAEAIVMTTEIVTNGANNHTFDFGFSAAPTCTLTATCNATNQTSCSPTNGSASVTASGGQGSITYLWSSGETTASISGKTAGTYIVTVTDNVVAGCTATCQAIISSTITLPTATCASTNNTNCATPNGTATVTTDGNQILWSTGGTTAAITGLNAGTYVVTVTNTASGCTNTCQSVVTNTSTPPNVTCSSVNNSNCATPNGSATATATGVTYAWSNGGNTATISGLANGTYTVTVTSTTTSCTATCAAIVGSTATIPTATCASTNNTNCATPNGTATVTTDGNQILWSTGGTTASITGLNAGTYTVTVTNTTTGCTNTCQSVVTNTSTPPTVTCSSVNNSNCATPNGSATATATGVTYTWSNGGNTATISGLSDGTYTVTVTNTTTGCTSTCQTIVGSAIVNPTCNIAVNSQPTCANLSGGSVTVNPSPAGTYTYAWSDGGTASANRTGLTGGTYTVTVTNTVSSCTGVCQVTLDTPMNCCAINPATIQGLDCMDNGTPNLMTDNRLRIFMMATNTNATLTTYTLTVNGGTTITPSTGTYGIPAYFTLGPGTGGTGATYTITLTDFVTPGCTGQVQVVSPMNCEPAMQCPTPECGSAMIQVNGN